MFNCYFPFLQDEAICCDKGYKNLESRQVAKNESESVESNVNMIETSEIDCDSFTVETHQANIEEEMRNNLPPPPPPQNGVEAESFQNFHSLSAVLVAEVDSAEPPPSSQQGESQLSVPPCETETTDQSAQSQELVLGTQARLMLHWRSEVAFFKRFFYVPIVFRFFETLYLFQSFRTEAYFSFEVNCGFVLALITATSQWQQLIFSFWIFSDFSMNVFVGSTFS